MASQTSKPQGGDVNSGTKATEEQVGKETVTPEVSVINTSPDKKPEIQKEKTIGTYTPADPSIYATTIWPKSFNREQLETLLTEVFDEGLASNKPGFNFLTHRHFYIQSILDK